ncbi:MAG TPA: DUF6055 domain-containing protein [Polyangiales bacterium]
MACDPGTSETTWATGCATAPTTTCVAGSWQDPGSTTGDPLQCQSAHFAVHSPNGTISPQQCTDATSTLENTIWPNLFGSPIFFPEPYCQSSTKYKASIVIRSGSGLTGGGWGSGYMGMWIGPGATADHWGLAHEFMHAVQSTTHGLDCGAGPNTCGWIWESHANWRAHQLPEYHAPPSAAATVHCSELLVNAPHLYLGSTRDRYCNWQFMEYLKDKYCYQAVNDIWTAAPPSGDPFDNIMSTRGWNLSQLNDFLGEWAMHNVTWDYRDPKPAATAGQNQGAFYRSQYGLPTDASKAERHVRLTRLQPLDASYADNRRFESPAYWAPQRWGYNIVRLIPDAGASSVRVTFRGVLQAGANADFRWGLVATDAGITTPRYSALQHGTDGELRFCVAQGESLFLVVMATPSVQQHIVWDQAYASIYRYPYMIALEHAWPEGFVGGHAADCSAGLTRISNGGGCGSSGLAASVFVGPYARVLGGSVSGSARIEDHATVVRGNITGGVVGALTIVGTDAPNNGFDVGGSAQAHTTFYPLGFFEAGQLLSGTAQLRGDVELRGQGFGPTTGTYSGFVDSSSPSDTQSDVTHAPPYVWR